MHGVRDEVKKLLADFRTAIANLDRAKQRLQRSAFMLNDAQKAVAKMHAGTSKTFAEQRVAAWRKKLAGHGQRLDLLNKSASATWSALKLMLKPLGIDIGPLRGVGQAQIILPVVAVAGLLLAAAKLYSVVVNDTKHADFEAEKLKLLADGKVSPKELADAFKEPKPAGGIFDDIPKLIAGAAVLLLLPTLVQLTRKPA